jgi:hypothetical protein
MPITPKDSPITLSAEQENHVGTLETTEEITRYMKQLALEQGLIRPLNEGSQILVDVPQSARPQQVTKTITVNGETKRFTGATEAEVDAAQIAFFRTLNSQQRPHDPATGQFVSPADQGKRDKDAAVRTAAAADLELRWKRGEISGSEYLEKSGAMETYLANRGLDVESLKAAAEEKRADAQVVQSWDEATKQFIKNNPDWPGGENLKTAMAYKLAELGLTGEPSVESLERAYNALAMETEMAKANTASEMDAIRQKYSQ